MKTIKSRILAATATVLLVGGIAQGQTFYATNSSSTTVGTLIPDGNPIGLASGTNWSGIFGSVVSVTVNLNITGGFNGDLYAYLAGPAGGFAVLLNRSGLSSTNAFGYGDTGINLTFATGGVNVHNYQLDPSYPSALNGSGQLTGIWAPDGRNIDPQSLGSLFDSTSPTADLTSFNGGTADGLWTLFVADMSGGGQATLVSWGLTVVTAPEPQTWLLVAGGVGVLLTLNRRRKL